MTSNSWIKNGSAEIINNKKFICKTNKSTPGLKKKVKVNEFKKYKIKIKLKQYTNNRKSIPKLWIANPLTKKTIYISNAKKLKDNFYLLETLYENKFLSEIYIGVLISKPIFNDLYEIIEYSLVETNLISFDIKNKKIKITKREKEKFRDKIKKKYSTKVKIHKFPSMSSDLLERENYLYTHLNFLSQYINDNVNFINEKVDFNQYNNIRRGYLKRYSQDEINKILVNSKKLSGKIITFIMCLKNRANRARISIESLVTPANAKFCDFIIVEDKSDGELNLHNFSYKKLLRHYLINTNIYWTRAGILNYGVRKSKTPFIAMWDADFLYPENFIEKLIDYIKKFNFNQYIMTINMYETEDSDMGIKGSAYSSLWIYEKSKFMKLRGFNENFHGWGLEDREIEYRMQMKFNLKTIYSFGVIPKLFLLHLSHNNNIRGKDILE